MHKVRPERPTLSRPDQADCALDMFFKKTPCDGERASRTAVVVKAGCLAGQPASLQYRQGDSRMVLTP